MAYTHEQLAKALHVSKNTATKYIQGLMDEGKFKKTIPNSYRYTDADLAVLSDLFKTDLKLIIQSC